MGVLKVVGMDAQNGDLIYNVAQLLKQPVGATRKLNLDTPELRLEDHSMVMHGSGPMTAHDLTGSAKATRINDGVLVQGDVAAIVGMECSRCLTDLSLPVEAVLEDQFQPIVDVLTGTPIQRAEYEDNDAAFQIDANHLMDLSEPVRQAILVALPMKPLCRDDCAGLCPICGANLNEGPCGCESETVDSRWLGLRELRLEEFPVGDNSQN